VRIANLIVSVQAIRDQFEVPQLRYLSQDGEYWAFRDAVVCRTWRVLLGKIFVDITVEERERSFAFRSIGSSS